MSQSLAEMAWSASARYGRSLRANDPIKRRLNHIGQLGNTGLRPFTLRSIGRQLRDAPSDWHRSSFAFPGLRRFRIRSCHARPDRRGHIRHATHRRWLLRSSQCCCLLLCLTVRVTTNSVVQADSVSMFCIRYGMDLGPLCTPAVLLFASGHVRKPEPDCAPFGLSLEQPLVAHSW